MSAEVKDKTTKVIDPSETKTQVRSLEERVTALERLRYYILHFKQFRGQPRTKVFPFDGQLADAITRSKEHCDRMGYRFLSCHPFIVDLEHAEHLKKDYPQYQDD